MKFKKGVIVWVFVIALSLITVTFAGAKALYETKPVPTEKRHTISEITSSKSKWEKVATGSGFMEGINFDREGKIWLVSPTTGEILKVTGTKAKVMVSDKDNIMPIGAKFHKDGRLFITDGKGKLFSYNPATGERKTIIASYDGKPLNGLNDLVFDKKGGLYFTEPMGSSATHPKGRVFYLAPGTTEAVLFSENIAYPNGITISADGQRVYISEFDKNQVLSVPSVTAENSPETPFVFARFEGGIGPDGLTVDTDGNLYVAHFQAGEIAVVDANGFKYGTIRLPKDEGTFATNLAFQNGYLYVTESSKNEIWRIKVKKKGLPLYGSN